MSRAAAVSIVVQVKPGAKAPGIALRADGTLVVRVRERAVEGKANDAVRAALASALRVAKSTVSLNHGATAPRKTFIVAGLAPDEIRAKIEALQTTP